MKIDALKCHLMKDSYSNKSLFSKIRIASEEENYEEVSNLQLEVEQKMSELRELYSIYKKNLLDI
jgi:glutamine synthetase